MTPEDLARLDDKRAAASIRGATANVCGTCVHLVPIGDGGVCAANEALGTDGDRLLWTRGLHVHRRDAVACRKWSALLSKDEG